MERLMKYLLFWYCAYVGALHTKRTPAMFSNPIIWNDLADIDIFRVDEIYYYMASSMHFSPGAPILQSKDMVNWEYISFAVPRLDFNSPAYSLEDGMRAYARGVWASTLRYRQSNGLWYFIGCVDFNATYFFTSPSVEGPFKQAAVLDETCLYDCGLLIDDDDIMYVTHGSTNLSVAQLTPDGLGIVKDEVVHTGTIYIEGSRMYKRNGIYYIITDQPVNGEYVLKSTSGPFGPYEFGVILNNTLPPSAIAGGDTPHQGGIVDTPSGDWYYMAFVDINSDSTGRIPVLSSLSWTSEGWPVLDLAADNTWPESLPYPVNDGMATPNTDWSLIGVDRFADGELSKQWEWNHNPNVSQYSVFPGGVKLSTATVTDDIYQAQNTLTHRTLGPASEGTILLDFAKMRDGDRTGLSMFRDSSAWIGIGQDNGIRSLIMRTGMTMNGSDDWATISTGYNVATIPLEHLQCGESIYLRCRGDFRPQPTGTLQAQFSYSTDGRHFTTFGDNLTMVTDYEFFQAYRFAIFNYATEEIGGSVVLREFGIDTVPV